MSNSKQAEETVPFTEGGEEAASLRGEASGDAPGGPARSPEDASAEVAGEPSEAEGSGPEALREQVRALEVEVEQQRERALRLQAEMENLHKRAQRDVENAHKFGIERFVAELLPVKDSMELGLQAAAGEDAAAAGIREGVELTLKMLGAALEKFGVAEVDPSAERFDPEFHQAMSIQPAEGVASGTVLQVIQKGYTLSGRLVRPAMVIVAQ